MNGTTPDAISFQNRWLSFSRRYTGEPCPVPPRFRPPSFHPRAQEHSLQLAARSPSNVLHLRNTIIAQDSLRTPTRLQRRARPAPPLPSVTLCAKPRPPQPPFLEGARMCRRARAPRIRREASAERLLPLEAQDPDFRSSAFASLSFAVSLNARADPPSSGSSLPALPAPSRSFPPCPAGSGVPGSPCGGAWARSTPSLSLSWPPPGPETRIVRSVSETRRVPCREDGGAFVRVRRPQHWGGDPLPER